MSHELEPRVSVLEKGQEALQQDLLKLSSTVKEQGTQLTLAIKDLAVAANENNTKILDKIAIRDKTDWQTIFAGLTFMALIVAAISTPVWMNFSVIERERVDFKIEVKELALELKETREDMIRLQSAQTSETSIR